MQISAWYQKEEWQDMQDQREKHNKDYSQVNKETKRKLRNDKREYYKENEAEKTANRGEMSEVYRITR